jgi:hypothetical protein
MSVVVNLGEADFDYHGTVLPQYGLLIESPTFLAFCAKRFNGVDYPEPSLFTIQSLDNLPIPDSHHLRLSHAFGPHQLPLPTTRAVTRTDGCTLVRSGAGAAILAVPSEGEVFLN